MEPLINTDLPNLVMKRMQNGHQSKLGGVVKISFYFGYKIDILRDNELKFCRSIQCNPTNYFKTFKIDRFMSKIKTYFYNTSEFGLDVRPYITMGRRPCRSARVRGS